MDREITISIKTVLFFFLMLFSVYIVYTIRPVIVTLLIATIIVIAMEHPIKALMNQKVMNRPLSRGIAVLLAYFLLILILVAMVTLIVPPVLTQGQRLIVRLSYIIREIPGFQQEEVTIRDFLGDISRVSQNFFTTTYSFFSGIAAVFSVLIISIYMSIDWPNIKRRFYALFTGKNREEVKGAVEEVETSIGHWVKGQLYLMLIVGLLSFAGLVFLGVEYALALALISGLLEIVPVLGPVIAVVIAGVVGFSESFTKGIMVISLFTLIQQLENNFLVPKVMQKVSGFSPLSILIALLVGTTLLGAIGAIISVPVMMIFVVILKRAIQYSPLEHQNNKQQQ